MTAKTEGKGGVIAARRRWEDTRQNRGGVVAVSGTSAALRRHNERSAFERPFKDKQSQLFVAHAPRDVRACHTGEDAVVDRAAASTPAKGKGTALAAKAAHYTRRKAACLVRGLHGARGTALHQRTHKAKGSVQCLTIARGTGLAPVAVGHLAELARGSAPLQHRSQRQSVFGRNGGGSANKGGGSLALTPVQHRSQMHQPLADTAAAARAKAAALGPAAHRAERDQVPALADVLPTAAVHLRTRAALQQLGRRPPWDVPQRVHWQTRARRVSAGEASFVASLHIEKDVRCRDARNV